MTQRGLRVLCRGRAQRWQRSDRRRGCPGGSQVQRRMKGRVSFWSKSSTVPLRITSILDVSAVWTLANRSPKKWWPYTTRGLYQICFGRKITAAGNMFSGNGFPGPDRIKSAEIPEKRQEWMVQNNKLKSWVLCLVRFRQLTLRKTIVLVKYWEKKHMFMTWLCGEVEAVVVVSQLRALPSQWPLFKIAFQDL